MFKNKILFLVKAAAVIIVFFLWATGLKWVMGQPVYQDSYSIAGSKGTICVVNRMDQKIEQEFEAPCDKKMEGLLLQIGNYAGESRSGWKAELSEAGTGKLIYEGTFEAADLKDNQYNNILDKPVEVQKGLGLQACHFSCLF